MTDTTSSELLAVTAARELARRRVVFAGHGLPTLAVSLAQRTVSPEIEIVYESGVTGAHPVDLPQSIADSMLVTGAECVLGMPQLFSYVLQGRRIDVGFLGAAQIDRYGGLNSSIIGDWAKPKARLPGSGGAIEVMANAGEIFVVMRRHTARTFVEELDFCTSPSPRRAREAGGGVQPHGKGVTRVITDLGIMARDGIDDELELVAVHPGVTAEQVRAATGWDLKVADDLAELAPPSGDELRLLREELDPNRIYLR
ncbi:glutaconate CoA-transferase subunit B [Saccharopolyspora shandongensis]|uniref:Glutaconate CoA-transferase subunit B n=1 Tax=Saccharopolyspora shandongensis TaxID=418495 RepID=A0A1H2UQA0_9PSEU|nr:CoA-transferase [Saccharopolyspora shandongensis]SDW57734.1 glutaconate CoA-transferase subunit B [Saccharopolyspora shandongensis]